MEREALRARTTELLGVLRSDDSVSQALFELLDIFARRLDRLELGDYGPEEAPTRPDRKSSSGSMSAVIGEIFDEAKKGKPTI